MMEAGITRGAVQAGWQPPPGAGYPPPGPPAGAPASGRGSAPAPPPGGDKPVTGSPQTMALYATTIDPQTGLPRGEKPPAGTAAVVALICGFLLCLGPLTGVTAIVAGFIGRKAARDNSATVGGGGMALAGIVLGAVNLLLFAVGLVLFLASAYG